MDCVAPLAMTMGRKPTRQIDPTGKSAKTCPVVPRKIFRSTGRANQRYQLACLTDRNRLLSIEPPLRRQAVTVCAG
jgi:hypothetical protein